MPSFHKSYNWETFRFGNRGIHTGMAPSEGGIRPRGRAGAGIILSARGGKRDKLADERGRVLAVVQRARMGQMVEPYPAAALLHAIVLNLHSDSRPDASEGGAEGLPRAR
jgi:hypothetical protein